MEVTDPVREEEFQAVEPGNRRLDGCVPTASPGEESRGGFHEPVAAGIERSPVEPGACR
ncbi:hypothetical protein [Saccharothrix syringae]|uniref:hypothetical protein n=1 Tax=Saccharothrix syringae TaxID=103733 RepID=UPI001292CFF4|nr:hypothetical protein [Saccharothrix syringae]